MTDANSRRNVFLLAACQALSMTAMTIMVTVAALTGRMLAENDSLATLPLAFQFLATWLTTIPASSLMQRIGRRSGFSIGASLGVLGAALIALAIIFADFRVMCLGSILVGMCMGFALFYRFAAADAADDAFRAKAISWVISGGVIAALVGPELARHTRDLAGPYLFAGSFLAIAALFALSCMLVQFLRIPRPAAAGSAMRGRPLAEIMAQPKFIVAVLSGMVAYGVMNFIMVATPFAVEDCGFGPDATPGVIQLHALGMFAPAFITGSLINRFGVRRILIAGALLLAGAIAADLTGLTLWNFWIGLTLLGVGWNFLFVGASTLLTEAYRPEERSRIQGINDFFVFGTVACSSFMSGWVYETYGWGIINAVGIPLISLSLLATLWLIWRSRRVAVAAG
ncbi:MAG TPA: MFS transporter [Dongiaceae bacterium]